MLNECETCSSDKIMINNTCYCDTDNELFYALNSTTACQSGCPACNSAISSSECYYRDYTTRQCANPPIINCS